MSKEDKVSLFERLVEEGKLIIRVSKWFYRSNLKINEETCKFMKEYGCFVMSANKNSAMYRYANSNDIEYIKKLTHHEKLLYMRLFEVKEGRVVKKFIL